MNKGAVPLLLVVMLWLTGCGVIRNPITDPKPMMLETELNYGPENFRQGYYDGCHSALSAYGNSYMKTVYGIHKTPKYEDDQIYAQVYKDAWNFCYMWLFVYYRDDGLL